MPGFESNKFVNLTEKEAKHLKCSICHNIYNDAIRGDCDHTFCKSCVQQWIESNQKGCPECREDFPTRKRSLKMKPNLVIIKSFLFHRNLLANNLVNELKTKCDFESNGCHEVIEFGLLSDHLKQCEHRLCKTCGLPIILTNPHNCVEALKKSFKDFKEKSEKSEQRVNELTLEVQELEDKCQRSKQMIESNIKTNRGLKKLLDKSEANVKELTLKLSERENDIKILTEYDIKNSEVIKELTQKYENNKQEIQRLTQIVNSKEKGIDSSISDICQSLSISYTLFGNYKTTNNILEIISNGFRIKKVTANRDVKSIYNLYIYFKDLSKFMYCFDPSFPTLIVRPTTESCHAFQEALSLGTDSPNNYNFDVNSKDEKNRNIIFVLNSELNSEDIKYKSFMESIVEKLKVLNRDIICESIDRKTSQQMIERTGISINSIIE